MRYGIFFLAGTSLLATPAWPASFGVALRLTVPQVCTAFAQEAPSLQGDTLRIGRVRELCNSGGYRLLLHYTPGSLDGAVATFAGQSVALDGSGTAVLADTSGAMNRVSELTVVDDGLAGQNVRFNLQMVPR